MNDNDKRCTCWDEPGTLNCPVCSNMEAPEPFPYSTIPLPDGIVIGGPWPDTIISWPGGKCRSATKPEYDLFQALEKAHAQLQTPHPPPQHDSP